MAIDIGKALWRETVGVEIEQPDAGIFLANIEASGAIVDDAAFRLGGQLMFAGDGCAWCTAIKRQGDFPYKAAFLDHIGEGFAAVIMAKAKAVSFAGACRIFIQKRQFGGCGVELVETDMGIGWVIADARADQHSFFATDHDFAQIDIVELAFGEEGSF